MTAFCGRLAYDGTAYHGFQFQLGVPTIQGTLEAGLDRFAGLHGRVAGSGRTDTGVHARGQVITVEVDWRHGPGALQAAWNAHLPPDVQLRQMRLAPPGFHPRFDALQRTYTYSVVSCAGDSGSAADQTPAPRHSPLTDRFALFEPAALDVPSMKAAAALLVGEHDFAAFGWPTQGESTVRNLLQAEWKVLDTGCMVGAFPNRRLVFTIAANGFLRRMVRKIAGTLLDVGRGRRSVASVGELLKTRSRQDTSPPAPALGLVLECVGYAPRWGLWQD